VIAVLFEATDSRVAGCSQSGIGASSTDTWNSIRIQVGLRKQTTQGGSVVSDIGWLGRL